ncbi:manganese-binding transcriptional regulator MntR [bacterium]|nr:MAG: manganese-binding transcriptional regulator MntR [bacterium]
MATAARFQRTRDDHARELAEDYVEMVRALIVEHGEARSVDMAERLGVSPVTVGKTLKRLQREGLVTFLPYRSIFLTEEGKALAEASEARHTVVRDVLLKLGVDAETAETDAEGIEHHVSEETLKAFAAFLRL